MTFNKGIFFLFLGKSFVGLNIRRHALEKLVARHDGVESCCESSAFVQADDTVMLFFGCCEKGEMTSCPKLFQAQQWVEHSCTGIFTIFLLRSPELSLLVEANPR